MYSKRNRRSIRLKGCDYSRAGAFFVTVCVQNRECLLGDIVDGKMMLNDAGRMVETVWDELPNHYGHVDLDSFVVMPNHVHGIIVLRGTVGAGFKPAPTGNPDPVGMNYPHGNETPRVTGNHSRV